MVKAHAGKVAAARQIGEGGGVITLGASDRCVLRGKWEGQLLRVPTLRGASPYLVCQS